MPRYLRLLPVFVAWVALCSGPVLGQSSDVDLGDGQIYAASLRALTILFVLAIVVENALSVIFNWRVFLYYFNLKGIKTVIMIVVSYLLVQALGIDVVQSLLAAYNSDGNIPESSALTAGLTALVISGGSSGVNNLMVSLGYRNDSRENTVNPKPPVTVAWISVSVTRDKAVGPVFVEVTEDASAPANTPTIAGSVLARKRGLLSFLTRNNDRFPPNGGHEVAPGKAYRISVSGRDAAGNDVRVDVNRTALRFSAGAMIDFAATL